MMIEVDGRVGLGTCINPQNSKHRKMLSKSFSELQTNSKKQPIFLENNFNQKYFRPKQTGIRSQLLTGACQEP
jgi:hypothetical protein